MHKTSEPGNSLYRVKRGLAGYISYLAACEMNEAFSEYVLYEPILRILTSRGYTVSCEYECPGIAQPHKGDRKRIDFHAVRPPVELAIEVKWAKSENPNVKRDAEKLKAFVEACPDGIALLCVFGRKTFLEALDFSDENFKERGKAVYADLRNTKFGCRIYELKQTRKKRRKKKKWRRPSRAR